MRPVGVGSRIHHTKTHGQADMVALWLGTFELLKDETTKNGGHLLSNESIALATTALIPLIDLDEPWIGRVGPGRLTNTVTTREEAPMPDA